MIKKMVTSLGCCLAFVLLTQCGSVPSTYYYRIDYNSPPPVPGETPLPVTLAVGHFETDMIYEGDRIVYRNSPYEVQYYHYRRWVAPPRKLVEDALLNQFQSAGAFRRVVGTPATEKVDYVLRGKIKAFEEWDEKESWYGRVSVKFELYDAATNDLVWKKEYTEQKPALTREPLEVVKSISESFNKVVHTALVDIAGHLR